MAVLQVGLWPGLLFLGLITGGRVTGAFESLEGQALDAFLRARPPETQDSRILLVSIDEPSIQSIGTYPIPDQQLVNLLNQLQRAEPRVIGLDLFRDLPIEPGHSELSEAFQTMENLIGIEKVLPPIVAPPPSLPPERVGFVDAPLDEDGNQRRMILGTQTDQGFRFSLSLLLADAYLAEENIFLENGRTDPTTMRFRDAELPRLQPNFGGYIGAETGEGAIQVLLNFRQGEKAFRVVTFQDVVAGKVDPEWVRDRVVIIGAATPSIPDYVSAATLSTVRPTENLVYGIEIHAHSVSQMLSATLDQRPLIRTWSELGEYLWITLWGVVGIVVAAYSRSPLKAMLWIILGGVGIIGICYGMLIAGWWIPVVPTVAGLFLNSAGLAAFYQYNRVIQTKIKAQQQAVSILEEAKSALEIKVAERTAELQQSNIELAQAKNVVEMSSQAKSDFLAHMSHELRTPLNAILGFSQLIAQDTTLSETNQKRMGLISHSGEHLLGLINEILELTKLEAGKQVLHPAPFNLAALIETIEALFRLRIEQKGIQFLIEQSPDMEQLLVGDAQKLRQVLLNLLSNALKFTERGQIVLRVSQRQQQQLDLCFEVEDTGEGIAPAELHKLFVPFVQTASGEKANTGTGLGLPISEQFVRLMGGDIQVSSQLGQGTCFSFTVQVQVAGALAPQTSPALSELQSQPSQPAFTKEAIASQDSENSALEAGPEAGPETGSEVSIKATPESITHTLKAMPPEWLSALHQATKRLNGRQVMKLLNDIPETQAEVEQRLRELAENYEYEKIAKLIEALRP